MYITSASVLSSNDIIFINLVTFLFRNFLQSGLVFLWQVLISAQIVSCAHVCLIFI